MNSRQPTKQVSGSAMLALWMWVAFLAGGMAVLFGFLPFDTVRIALLGIFLIIAVGASFIEERNGQKAKGEK